VARTFIYDVSDAVVAAAAALAATAAAAMDVRMHVVVCAAGGHSARQKLEPL